MEINTEAINIDLLIRESLGSQVVFSNGCYLSLVDSDGVFFGENPYGQVWACNKKDYLESIKKWLLFWDEPRDERGCLITEGFKIGFQMKLMVYN